MNDEYIHATIMRIAQNDCIRRATEAWTALSPDEKDKYNRFGWIDAEAQRLWAEISGQEE